MTTYVLDVATWRCGRFAENTKNEVGAGKNAMVNDRGYSCCLGQFALQKLRKKGKSRKEVASLVADNLTPNELAKKLGVRYDANFVVEKSTKAFTSYTITQLSTQCIRINDDKTTTVRDKIKKLRAVLKQHGHTLRVLNQHLIP